jgi:flagellar biosynthesis protein FliQ
VDRLLVRLFIIYANAAVLVGWMVGTIVDFVQNLIREEQL